MPVTLHREFVRAIAAHRTTFCQVDSWFGREPLGMTGFAFLAGHPIKPTPAVLDRLREIAARVEWHGPLVEDVPRRGREWRRWARKLWRAKVAGLPFPGPFSRTGRR